MNQSTRFILFTLLSLAITGYVHSQRLYHPGDKKQISTGQLSEQDSITLTKLLAPHTKTGLNDTIIIKYDYNRESCWDMLDRQADERILEVIGANQARIIKAVSERNKISIFEFKENGKHLNKLKRWDGIIITDDKKELFTLLFKERCTCGNSIIIVPGRRYIFVRSDAHFEALDFSAEKIKTHLNN